MTQLPRILPFSLNAATGAFLPLLWHVRLHSFEPDAENDLGNEVERWLPPVRKDVYGWGPPQIQPKEAIAGDRRVTVQVELMVPPDFFAKDMDRIQLGDRPEMWRVVGPLETYEANPLIPGWNPGSVVNLIHVGGT